MSPDDPEQFSEDRIELYKKFAGAFNKYAGMEEIFCINPLMFVCLAQPDDKKRTNPIERLGESISLAE